MNRRASRAGMWMDWLVYKSGGSDGKETIGAAERVRGKNPVDAVRNGWITVPCYGTGATDPLKYAGPVPFGVKVQLTGLPPFVRMSWPSG